MCAKLFVPCSMQVVVTRQTLRHNFSSNFWQIELSSITSPEIQQGKIGLQFFDMWWKYYRKRLKSCTGVLLRADLTGHGHPTLFGQRIPVRDLNSFFIIFCYIISTKYKKFGNLYCPVHISGISHGVSFISKIIHYSL